MAFVHARDIRTLNFEFRDKDETTDVLSFTLDGPEGEMVGEIVIYAGYVDFDRESVEELVVHGALHLAGMDHGEEFIGTEMHKVQEAILEETREA